MRVLGAFHRHGKDLVVGEELDRPLGASRRVRDEDQRVAALAAAADLFDPVFQAAGELDRRLTGDVDRRRVVVGERQRLECRRAFEPCGDCVPVDQQVGRRRHALTFLHGFVVAALHLLPQLAALCVDFIRLRHEHDRTDGREVLEDRRRPIQFVRIAGQFLQRRDGRLIERDARTLRGRVVGTDRLDRVADELETNGLGRAGRVEVHDTTADAELAGLVDGILPGVAGLGEELGKHGRRDLLTGRQGHGGAHEPRGRREAREQRRRRHDQQPGRARRHAVQRAGSGRGDVEMRFQAPIRIDFVRGEGQDGRARRPRPTVLRARPERTARRRSSARPRRRSGR